MFAIWLIMLATDLIIPILMIVFGSIFKRSAPNEINGFFGYRTELSMKSKDTWEYAHKYFGKLWYIVGLVILPISVIPNIFTFNTDIDTASIVGVAVMIIQTLPMLIPIFATEIKLKKVFDKNGNRKDI